MKLPILSLVALAILLLTPGAKAAHQTGSYGGKGYGGMMTSSYSSKTTMTMRSSSGYGAGRAPRRMVFRGIFRGARMGGGCAGGACGK